MHALPEVEIREGVYQRFHPQAEQEYLAAQPEVPRIIYCRAPAGLWHSLPCGSSVTGQGSGRPEQRKQKKQLAPRDTRAPSPERTQAWDNGGRSHSRRPHDRSGNWGGLLHRGLLRLHSKKRKMFEQPPESSGPAFGIASPADGIESEANAKNSSDNPVGDGMAAEIQENPAHDHGSDGGRDRMCRPRR